MLILLSIIFFLISKKVEWILWSVIPLSLFLDFWAQRPLGLSGLTILAFWLFLWLIFGRLEKDKQRIKI